MQEKLELIRCGSCQRKLGEGCYTRLEIKCPRCKALNVLRASAADRSSQSSTQARPRASSVKGTKDDDKSGAESAL
ncbi:MAG: Com family DNA-binding transcriptional regulator [Pseudomonadota bacterium]